MASNYQALQIGRPNTGVGVWTSALTANSKSDGTGTIATDMVKIFTADATYGGYLTKVICTPTASVASTSTTASVARFYLSSQTAGATTNANTRLIKEVNCGSQIADRPLSAVVPIEVDFEIQIPLGYTLLVSMPHAAAANTSWSFVAIGGDFIVVP